MTLTPFPALARGLYAITPDSTEGADALLARVLPVLDAGVACLQLRAKSADAALRLAQARALRAATQARGVPFLINDDVGLCEAVAADGVHLGMDDMAIDVARARLGAGAIIGATCHGDIARARDAIARGASYVAFGAMYPSGTKPSAAAVGLGVLRAARGLPVPCVAIGGITPDNARDVVCAGADLIAVIGGLFDAPDPALAAKAYAAAFKETAHAP